MRLKSWLVLLVSASWLWGCSSDTTYLDNERDVIVRYLTGQRWENIDTLDNVFRYVINRDRPGYADAPTAEPGNKIVINYSVYLFSSSTGEGQLIYSNNPETQEAEKGLNPEYWPKVPFDIELGRTPLISGLNRGLPGVKQGDTLKLFMCSNMGYGEKPFGVIPAKTSLVWNLGIKKVIK